MTDRELEYVRKTRKAAELLRQALQSLKWEDPAFADVGPRLQAALDLLVFRSRIDLDRERAAQTELELTMLLGWECLRCRQVSVQGWTVRRQLADAVPSPGCGLSREVELCARPTAWGCCKAVKGSCPVHDDPNVHLEEAP